MASKNVLQRNKLFAKNPNCHWCGVKTHNNSAGLKDTQATLDHVTTKNLRDISDDEYNSDSNTVLSCWKCNNERNIAEVNAIKKIVKGKKINSDNWAMRERNTYYDLSKKQSERIILLEKSLAEKNFKIRDLKTDIFLLNKRNNAVLLIANHYGEIIKMILKRLGKNKLDDLFL